MSYDPFDLDAQHDKVQASSGDAERARRQAMEDIGTVMSTEQGRRVLWGVISRVFQTSYADSAHGMAFNEGARNVGLGLISKLLEACPGEYMRMLEENHQ